LTFPPGVDTCFIALSSEAEGLRMDNVKMKGPRFDYERSVKHRRGCGEQADVLDKYSQPWQQNPRHDSPDCAL